MSWAVVLGHDSDCSNQVGPRCHNHTAGDTGGMLEGSYWEAQGAQGQENLSLCPPIARLSAHSGWQSYSTGGPAPGMGTWDTVTSPHTLGRFTVISDNCVWVMVSVSCWGVVTGRVECKASEVHCRYVLTPQQQGEDGQNCCPVSHSVVTTVRHETFLLSCSTAQWSRGLCWWCDSQRGAGARGLLHWCHGLWELPPICSGGHHGQVKHCAHQKERQQDRGRRQPPNPGASRSAQDNLKAIHQNFTKAFTSSQSP